MTTHTPKCTKRAENYTELAEYCTKQAKDNTQLAKECICEEVETPEETITHNGRTYNLAK